MKDFLLMALEYLREYEAYFHIGSSFGISESSALQKHRIAPKIR
ncbi:MAG: transposase family protein [Oscillospiraceae bacterium]|nr:transposase family protein [Oscillospiraceae bacterium]